MKVRLAGFEVSPASKRHLVAERDFEILRRQLAGERLDPELLPKPDPGTLAVFADETGDEFVMLPYEQGTMLMPWIAGDRLESGLQDAGGGGYVARGEATRLWQQHEKEPPPGPSSEQLMALLRAALKKIEAEERHTHNQGWPTSREREPERGSGEGRKTSPPSADKPDQKPAQKPDKPHASSLLDQIENQLPQIAAEQATALLANLWGGGLAGLSDNLVGALGGPFTGIMAQFALSKLMGEGPDDNSSTMDWAMATVAPKLGMKLLSGTFGGGGGSYASPALRAGDLDSKSNAILAGCNSVLIGGQPAAREGDPVDKKGVEIKFGVPLVKIGGQNAARVDIPAGYGAVSLDIPAQFLKGHDKKTLIGGMTNNPFKELPPVPDGVPGPAEGKNAPSRFDPVNNPDPPKEPGWYMQPDGEYRYWDPATGWGSSLSEYESLFNIGFVKDIFKAGAEPSMLNKILSSSSIGLTDPTKSGNWYLLGGWINLGSPEKPGAGTGSTWFVPDILFGMDMSKFFIAHDWRFRPDWAEFTKDWNGWFLHWMEAEWPAFLAGWNSHGYNPVGLLFQVVYSFATSAAGLSAWWAGWLKDWNRASANPAADYR